MPRTWTRTQRKQQAERIHRWQPWLYATGPKTRAGKARSSQNARKLITVQVINEMNAQWLYECACEEH